VWDAGTGKQTAILRGHDRGVDSAAFSPDGRRVVTASIDNTARLCAADTGKQPPVLLGYDSGVASPAFSPDGRRVVTTSSDSTTRLWDVDTGEPVAVLRGHDKGGGWIVFGVKAAFSPDGRRVVTASMDDNTARLWDIGAIPKGDLFAIACAWLPDKNLTDIARDYGLTKLEPICQGQSAAP
jgi:WD40 repeat protein